LLEGRVYIAKKASERGPDMAVGELTDWPAREKPRFCDAMGARDDEFGKGFWGKAIRTWGARLFLKRKK